MPKIEEEPQFHAVVLKHMIHKSYGTLNPTSPCMKQNHCKTNILEISWKNHVKVMIHIYSKKDVSVNQYL